MRQFQVAGVILLLLGVVILFVLRDPLYAFIVVVLKLIGIFAGFVLVLLGLALIFGGGWFRRRPRDWGESSLVADPLPHDG